MTSFGFLGLGNMGLEMANNLAKYAKEHNHPQISVWNRTASKCEKLSDVNVCPKPEQVVARSDIVFTCFINDQAVEEIYGQMLGHGRKGVIFVDHSTILPSTAGELH